MGQEHYWNSVSDTKVFTTPFQAEEFCQYVNRNAEIVDVGCGYGRVLNELYQLGYRNLLGIDFSEGMIARGHELFPELNLQLKVGDGIALRDGCADAVILFAVLTCIPDDAEQEKLLQEIWRVLKPGGVLYVNDFMLNTDQRNLTRYGKGMEKFGTYGVFELPEGAVLRHHSEERVQEMMKGYEPLRYEHLEFITMNGNRSNGFYFIGRKPE